MTTQAYNKGQWEKAKTLAAEGLLLAERYPNNWNYGNVIHNNHQVLGLLSLREGKQKEAVRSLLAAGKSPGSPQLDSFGPRMTLAKELLRKGEREAVLQYIESVALFWAKDNVQFPEMTQQNKSLIEQWKADIIAGKVPQHKLWSSGL